MLVVSYFFSGSLSVDEIREVLRLSGEDVSEAELEDILKKVDVDGDGNISIEGRSNNTSISPVLPYLKIF